MNPAASRLRALLARERCTLVPGAYNGLVALILERAGFDAIYAGGYAAAAAGYALPDLGLVSGSEMAAHVARMASAVTVPVIADADTGYGNALNATHTVRAFERAGAAAVQIEDQVFPKRCGHMEGKEVIPMEEMVRKVRTAVAARTDPDTVIIARSDAIAVTGIDDAIRRLGAYAEAGADLVFPDAPRSLEELSRIAAEVNAPLVANMSEYGKTPLTPFETLAELGYSLVLYPTATLFAAAKSAFDVASLLKRDGTTANDLERFLPFGDLNELVGVDSWLALEHDPDVP